MAKQEVFSVLRDEDRFRRLQTLRTLSEKNAASTTSALLDALEGTDKQLHSRSAWALSLLPLKKSPEVANALVSHLQNDPDTGVRLCCAIGLMSNEAPEVRDAYIHAVTDENEKVAQIALGQLGFRGGAEATTALFNTLSNPSWRVRLEACKSLITLKAADKRVVSTLEKMAQEPEAKVYDKELDEFDEINKQVHSEMPDEPEMEMWGKIGTILQKAREIAAQQR